MCCLGDDGATVVCVVTSMRDVILSCPLAVGDGDVVVCVAISMHDMLLSCCLGDDVTVAEPKITCGQRSISAQGAVLAGQMSI